MNNRECVIWTVRGCKPPGTVTVAGIGIQTSAGHAQLGAESHVAQRLCVPYMRASRAQLCLGGSTDG